MNTEARPILFCCKSPAQPCSEFLVPNVSLMESFPEKGARLRSEGPEERMFPLTLSSSIQYTQYTLFTTWPSLVQDAGQSRLSQRETERERAGWIDRERERARKDE